MVYHVDRDHYAKCIEISKRVRWDIDKDVIRGRTFDLDKKFLPDGISKVDLFDFLSVEEKKLLSRIEGRTYANMFGFVERFIVSKILDITRDHWLVDQVALEALVRFCDEELKHQELFRRIEGMMAQGMPGGYRFLFDPNEVAAAVLSKSTWAVMALILEIELFTQEHYKQSIDQDDELSDLYKDLFYFHFREETTHAMLDEIEWPREDDKLTAEQRDRSVDDLIDLVGAVDGILQQQSASDVQYFLNLCERTLSKGDAERMREGVLKAYRWQYIFSGVEHKRYKALLGNLTTTAQQDRIGAALAALG